MKGEKKWFSVFCCFSDRCAPGATEEEKCSCRSWILFFISIFAVIYEIRDLEVRPSSNLISKSRSRSVVLGSGFLPDLAPHA